MEQSAMTEGHLKLGRKAIGMLLCAGVMLTSILMSRTAAYSAELAYTPNEIVVTLRGGERTPAGDALVEEIARNLNASVVRKPLYSRSYLLRLAETSTATSTPASRVMAGKSTLLKRYQGVQFLDYNCRRDFAAVPNDEYYPVTTNPMVPGFLFGQWEMQPTISGSNTYNHIYAPEGWDLQKGSSKVIVAVIDSGVRDRPLYNDEGRLRRIIHPDLNGRVIRGYDLADFEGADDSNPGPAPGEVVTVTHGTHVAGTIAAQGDNLYGIAGVCWDNVKILPLKVCKDAVGAVDSMAVLDALYLCKVWQMSDPDNPNGNPLRVSVINMSIGGQMASSAEEEAIREVVRSGVVFVASAGNDWEDGPYAPSYPSAFEDAISVGATGYEDLITTFSNRGRAVDISAPGWDILSTVYSKSAATVDSEQTPNPYPVPPTVGNWPDKYGNSYGYMSGTSMASPHVAGAAALLRSHGVPAKDVKTILCQNATPRGIGRPNDTYGWGILNLDRALRAASIDVTLGTPTNGAVLKTNSPRIRIDFRHANPESIRVWIDPSSVGPDGIPTSQPTIAGSGGCEIMDWQKFYYTLDESAGKTYLSFNYTVQASKAVNGKHRIYALADSDISFSTPPAVPIVDSDSVSFRVEPQSFNTGWRLFSVPAYFDTSIKPEEILGNTGLLARWTYASTTYGEYAFYSLDRSRTDDEASFSPLSTFTNSLVHPIGQTDATPPAGLGYWLYLPSGADVAVPEGYGQPITDSPYTISLNYGWNMVGNPFTFAVDWNNVVVEYAGMRASMLEAVQNGWIENAIYRYDTTFRRYIYKAVTNAQLIPWEAEWLKVKVRTPEVASNSLSAWADEFNDGVLDMSIPEPTWYVGATSGTITEAGGMLRMQGIAGQSAYLYLTDKDYPIYSDFTVDTRLYLVNADPTIVAGNASADIIVRTNSSGTTGYVLSFNPTSSTISLKRKDTDAVIGGASVSSLMPSGTILYASFACVGTQIRVRVGTLPGQADVAYWEVEDGTFSGPGCFRLVNDGMLDCRWDYFRFRPANARPADMKIIVPPNPYTGATQ